MLADAQISQPGYPVIRQITMFYTPVCTSIYGTDAQIFWRTTRFNGMGIRGIAMFVPLIYTLLLALYKKTKEELICWQMKWKRTTIWARCIWCIFVISQDHEDYWLQTNAECLAICRTRTKTASQKTAGKYRMVTWGSE